MRYARSMPFKNPRGMALNRIAPHFLRIQTLSSQGRDDLDFHEVGVGSLTDALHAAFNLGAGVDESPRTPVLLRSFEKIAKRHLGIDTLRERGRDALDFHEVGVRSLAAAIKAAFALGKVSSR